MGKLFGTDGIRGRANEHPITPEMAMRVGRAVAAHVREEGRSPLVVVGMDTRLSGDMLAWALAAGVSAMGGETVMAGVLPTPGVAVVARDAGADAGVVISASHNPYTDNGIKLFAGDGFKLSEEREDEIERLILDDHFPPRESAIPDPGPIRRLKDADDRYLSFLKDAMPSGFSLEGMKIVLDCSNGATHRVAGALFTNLGADVRVLFASPDGRNINLDCGSQHTGTLRKVVREVGADVGLAFDGDGDRLIAVDETGVQVTGDAILAVCARDLKNKGKLANNLVVSTVMSNIGLIAALREMGIRHASVDVGDRWVMERMKADGAVLGGEDSGHMIFMDCHTTGDGMMTALRLLDAMKTASRPLSELAGVMTVYPQILINVDVKEKPDLATIPEIMEAIRSVEAELGDKGRVLVRYSGTQPMCRVMVEAPGERETRDCCQRIVDVVEKTLG
ncbi:MAG: phosphoglucosamine mutase [Desulfobacterales bacterium]|nr:phosphoglucosamine mutase [Desulfobacterales bacterium]